MKILRRIVFLAIALGLCVWLLTRIGSHSNSPSVSSSYLKEVLEQGEKANPSGRKLNSPGGSADSATVGKPQWGDIQWEVVAEIMTSKATGRSLLTDAQVEALLQKRGFTAPNLIAAWESTRERKWLERALEQFPNYPTVLMAALGETRDPGKQKELAERLKRATPDNPLPWVYQADQLFKDGKRAEAIAELQESLKKPGFYIYGNERIEAAHKLYLDAGLDHVGGEFLAIAQLPLDHLSTAMRVTRALQELTKDPVTSPESRREVAMLSYGLGQMFSTPEASRTALGQLVGISIESQALEFAQSIEENLLTVDPSARLAELNKQKAEVAEFTDLPLKMLKREDAALLSGYMQRLRRQGERNAIQWLKSQMR